MERPFAEVEASPSLPGRKAIFRGIQIFILLSLFGILIGFWWKRPSRLEILLHKANWYSLLLVLPLVAVDYVLGGLRYRVLFNGTVLPPVSLWNCMRSNWANIFMGLVTPFQTGGGPAQLYILWRCGAKLSDGVLASLVNFTATLVFFLLASLMALFFIPSNLFGVQFTSAVRAGFVFLLVIVGLILGFLFAPQFFVGWIERLINRLPFRKKAFVTLKTRLIGLLNNELNHFRYAFKKVRSRQRRVFLLILLLTLTLFSNKYFMGYLIASSFEKNIPFTPFISLQIIQLFLIYFAPTPGASGVAELSSVWLIAYLMSDGTLWIYTLLWRFSTTILGAIVGAAVLFFDLKKWMQSSE